MTQPVRKKLIEVALPLEAINKASAREKSIRHGHPSTLHLWWARRPLAAARAVIFSQMVDDPSSYPDLFPTEQKQEKERQRLFKIIEDLVLWENTTNEAVLQRAREEIWQSWRRACVENIDHPRAKELFDRHKLPAFHDPFAGGGALPLEAQRLGLEAYASDLNPVAVLINKAMIEIPPKFAGKPPVNPDARKDKTLIAREWKGAQGLAEDVRYYGKWMRDEAEKRIGHLYPKIEITADMAKERHDLKPLTGKKLTVIAWLWARTVKSPNPAFANVDVPLASTFMLSTKPGKEAYVEPVIENDGYRFIVKIGKPKNIEVIKNGTKLARANFVCLMSGTPISGDYIKEEGKAGRIGERLLAIVVEGERRPIFLTPTLEQQTASQVQPKWEPDVSIIPGMSERVVTYGYRNYSQLFSRRQLLALTTFSDLVIEVGEKIREDALSVKMRDDEKRLDAGGIAATAYGDAISVYLALGVGRSANYWSAFTAWSGDFIVQTFGRQSIPMIWDHAEVNPFSNSTGNWRGAIDWIQRVMVSCLSSLNHGIVVQSEAQNQSISRNKVVSTDPPYYDNIGYAELSDFFYIWLRRSLRNTMAGLFTTMAVPKSEELIAAPHRHGGKEKAEAFFLGGMTQAMHRLSEQSHPTFPITIYYAFKQSESEGEGGVASTGWETFLDAVIRAGFTVTGTWPMRTERDQGLKTGKNVLASSIILVCRPQAENAPTTTRREFLNQLKTELPIALAHLQKGNIAPVDFAQAAIGPGMAIYSRYSRILESSGKPMTVRTALGLINQTLTEVLSEQEDEFDADTRWALAWFEQHGFGEGQFGVAETLSKAKNTSVAGMVEAGILESKAGRVCLLKPSELAGTWNPDTDTRLTVWEMVHHLIRVLETSGEGPAAELLAKLGSKAEVARELAYRLYTICERKKRAVEAMAYNGLVQSWHEIARLAREERASVSVQEGMF